MTGEPHRSLQSRLSHNPDRAATVRERSLEDNMPHHNPISAFLGQDVPGAFGALRRVVPSTAELPSEAVRAYADIALNILDSTAGKERVGWPVFILQGLRLLALEKVLRARNLPVPPRMQQALFRIRQSPEIAATLRRAGIAFP